ncbi:MAG: Two-component nitrogen fixation transcriptional regulator FixJ [Myxococcaceae bacterium]|nr:Two-component nitrogen fixation transcriptional regulator FixJ [Myxococcaceae bacterium]
MFQRGWFHIDVRRQELLPDLLGVVRQYGPARVKPLSAEVVSELACDGRFAGLIVQLGADTLPWLERLFTHAPGLPVLALLERHDRLHINQLQAHGVSTLVLPMQAVHAVQFVQRALTHSFVPSARVGALIAHLAETRALTAREVQLVSYCLGDEPRSRVRRRLGITENTLKSQIRGLLRKCGERNLDSLAKNVLRSALVPQSTAARAAADDERLGSAPFQVAEHSEITRPALRLYRASSAHHTTHEATVSQL